MTLPWYEPADDFAFPFASSPAGWHFYLGCKHCRHVNEVPSRVYHVLDDSDDHFEASRLDVQAFRCDGCGRWLLIRHRGPQYYLETNRPERAVEVMHS